MPLLVVITVYVGSIPSAGSVDLIGSGADTVSKIIDCINCVLISKYDSLKQLPQVSLKALADKLYTCRLIGPSLLNSASIDMIIDEFKITFSFLKSVNDIKEHCKQFLKALNEVGGASAKAADALKEGFMQRCRDEVGIELEIVY